MGKGNKKFTTALHKDEDVIKSPCSSKTTGGYLVRRMFMDYKVVGKTGCFLKAILSNLLAIDVLRNYFVQSVDDSFGPLNASLRELFLCTNQHVGMCRINNDRINATPLFSSMCTTYPEIYVRGKGVNHYAFLVDLIDGLSREELKSRSSRGVVCDDSAFVDSMFRIKFASTALVLRVPYQEAESKNTCAVSTEKCLGTPKDHHTLGQSNHQKVMAMDHTIVKSNHQLVMAIFQLPAELKKSNAKSGKKLISTEVDQVSHAPVTMERCLDFNLTSPYRTKIERISKAPTILISKAPTILMICLLYNTQFTGPMDIGETLDLKPYMDPMCIGRDDTYIYRLVGMVERTTTGTINHAFSFVRGTNSKGCRTWYLADGRLIRKFPFEEIIRLKPVSLFYEKC